MPLISVVLPVYNGKKYIAQSIESILKQTFVDFELIIVDDCSNDGTDRLVEQYASKDNRIQIIHNETNQKLPQSLNIGYENAKGKYYTWTSDDNKYKERAFELMYNFMEENIWVGLVYCDYTTIDEEDHEIQNIVKKEPENLLYENTVGACFLYKREVAEEVGKYNPIMYLVEDYEYWIRIYQKYPVYHFENNLYFYRLHEESLTSLKLKTIVKQTAIMQMGYLDFILPRLGCKKKRYDLYDNIVNAGLSNQKEVVIEFMIIDKNYWIHYYYKKIKLYILKIIKVNIGRKNGKEKNHVGIWHKT